MKCAPRIWRKFTKAERKAWTKFYSMFFEEINYPPEWQGKKMAPYRVVLAHNLACQMVWLNYD